MSIWKWVQKYSDYDDRYRTDRHVVNVIFVDETLLQIEDKDYWLWVAYEPTIDAYLMMNLSRERTLFVCYQFFKQSQRRYGRKPIFTDGARWYNNACRWMRLEHHLNGTELKNVMEWFDSTSRTDRMF